MHLEDYLVKAPPTVYYIPDFITLDEEKRIIEHVNSAPKPKWTQLSHRRLQNWGGIPHPKGMIAEKLPEWLLVFTDKIGKLGLFGGKQPNHVLVNEYLPGQGIMPHLDGPLFYPTVTTISCGSHAVLNFYVPCQSDRVDMQSADDLRVASLLLERRSLVVLEDDMYVGYLHGIAEVENDIVNGSEANLELCSGRYASGAELQRTARISLTVRHVPRTTKLCIQVGR
ncbi:alpha-ketoglutarate-dependent dioxygenase alkB homolog 6 [Zootermopsis nevadensis]|uniref:Alkylated DNA repair protein alkB-like protein 6 n=1 Tax=Zootermopsis nevadensis TaxID=136037 RepID=A0A067R7Z5_ZOONE|nr:alpha-ketoglutarate-dependent dioxygenase alkB homolog 6 [Zootermopsis nevadensis]KDR15661.1 Alkylated DNA repair protein alkB-like protein 6 [Zootermopsis nevadensis]